MKDVPPTDDLLAGLDETARQLVLGARQERDAALAEKKILERSVRLSQHAYERENDSLKRANGRIMRLEEQYKAIQERVSAISGLPDSERAQQIYQHLERLRIAAQGLSEATIEYRTAFEHLTEMFNGLGMGAANPDNHDHAFDYRWRYDEDVPELPAAEPRRGGTLKDAIEREGRLPGPPEYKAQGGTLVRQNPSPTTSNYTINIHTSEPTAKAIENDLRGFTDADHR